MAISVDWHIHTTHSLDCGPNGKGIRLATLAQDAARRGITDWGITDHFFPGSTLGDLFNAKEEFGAPDLPGGAHFGVEAGVVSRWELEEIESGRHPATPHGIREGGPEGDEPALGLTEEDIREYGIEYVVAGVHWPLYVPVEREALIRDYHRQMLFLATHPLVDVVAHPWWWNPGLGWMGEDGFARSDPWIDDFGKIPLSLHDEFAAALKEGNTVAEINLDACLFNDRYPEDFTPQYLEYIAYLHERGVRLTVGSDTHGPAYEPPFARAAELLEGIGLSDKDLWRLPPRQGCATDCLNEDQP